jgi:hypothetical protein
MWRLFDITKDEIPNLSVAYYESVKDAAYNEGALNIKVKRLIS